jgi:hypothetical protein
MLGLYKLMGVQATTAPTGQHNKAVAFQVNPVTSGITILKSTNTLKAVAFSGEDKLSPMCRIRDRLACVRVLLQAPPQPDRFTEICNTGCMMLQIISLLYLHCNATG